MSDVGGFYGDAAEGGYGKGAKDCAAGEVPRLLTRYSQRRSKQWKCTLHPFKRHSPAAPLKVGGSTASKTPYKKRLRCGRNANAAGWRFWRPSRIPALRSLAAKAASSRSNP